MPFSYMLEFDSKKMEGMSPACNNTAVALVIPWKKILQKAHR